MRLPSLEVHAWDEKRRRWKRRKSIEARVLHAQDFHGDAVLPAVLDAQSRAVRLKLRLVARVHEAAPAPCMRVERMSTREPMEWRFDSKLTTGLLAAAQLTASIGGHFSPAAWLHYETRRISAWTYRLADD